MATLVVVRPGSRMAVHLYPGRECEHLALLAEVVPKDGTWSVIPEEGDRQWQAT